MLIKDGFFGDVSNWVTFKIFKRIDSYGNGILTLRLFKTMEAYCKIMHWSRFLQKNGYDVETINIVSSYQLNGVKKYFCLA